jgi:Na+-driven multidrug efflux pump
LLLFVVSELFGDDYLSLYGASPVVFSAAKEYFFWYKYTFLFLPIFTLMNAMVLADGDENLSMASGMVQVIGNIVCSICFANLIGIEGIGLGSFVGTFLSTLVTFAHLFRKGNSLKLGFYFSFQWLVDVTKYSVVGAGAFLFLACYTAAMNGFITFAYGPEMLVLGAIVLFVKEVQVLFDGVGEAFSPMMNIYMGEESYDGVKKCYRLALKVVVVEGFLLILLIFFLAPVIVNLYDITNPKAFSYAKEGMRIESLGLVFVGLLHLLGSYYLLAEKIKLGFAISALRDVIVPIPVSVVLGSVFGIYGLFVGVAVSPVLVYVLSVLYVRLKYGWNNYPLLIDAKLRGFRHQFYEFMLSPESIIGVQMQVENFLEENNIEKSVIAKVSFLIEEFYQLIYEKNGTEKTVCAECTVIIRETCVQIIAKDDGLLIDLSSDDMGIKSFVEYVVSCYMEKMRENRKYLMTMSCNRNTFKVNYGA